MSYRALARAGRTDRAKRETPGNPRRVDLSIRGGEQRMFSSGKTLVAAAGFGIASDQLYLLKILSQQTFEQLWKRL